MGAAAAPIAAIGTIISAASTAYGMYQQYKAADEAKDIADKNAKMAKMETEEQARRLEKQQEQQSARARAAAAASGVEMTGTVSEYLLELESEQQEQLDWLRKAGYSRARILKEQGDFAAQQAYQGMWSSAANLFSQAPGIYKAGQTAKWW